MEVSTSGIIPCKGRVRGHLVHRRTGEIAQPFEINNVTTYAAADILARLLGGDVTYVPAHMGFIYGPDSNPTPITDPPSSRIQTWDGLTSELSGDTGYIGNVLVTPMATAPRYAVNGEEDRYTGNMITLNANTASRFEYGFPLESPYSDELADGDYFYHALLLVRRLVGTNIEYIPYARVSLADGGAFLQKPAGYELALYWDVTYY